MRYKKVKDAMTPLESVYMLDINRRVDWATMREVGGCCIAQPGHWATMREVGGWVGAALLSMGTGPP